MLFTRSSGASPPTMVPVSTGEPNGPMVTDTGIAELFENDGLAPVLDTIARHLPPEDLGRLAQVNSGSYAVAATRLAKLEEKAASHIAQLESRAPTSGEWARTKPLNPNYPAVCFLQREQKLANAEAGSYTARITNLGQVPLPEGQPGVPHYDRFGRLLVPADEGLTVGALPRVSHVRLPEGWFLPFPVHGKPTCGAIVDHPIRLLVERGSDGKLGILTHDPTNETESLIETPLRLSQYDFASHSPNGRFILLNVTNPAHDIIRVFNTETEETFAATLPRIPNPRDECNAYISNNGVAALNLGGQNVRIDLPQHGNALVLTAEEFDPEETRFYSPSPRGDFFIKEVKDETGRRGLIVEGSGDKKIALEWGTKNPNARINNATVSPMGRLVAFLYSNGDVAIHSLAALHADVAAPAEASAAAPNGPLIFHGHIPQAQDFDFSEIAFCNRPDALTLLALDRTGETSQFRFKLMPQPQLMPEPQLMPQPQHRSWCAIV